MDLRCFIFVLNLVVHQAEVVAFSMSLADQFTLFVQTKACMASQPYTLPVSIIDRVSSQPQAPTL